MCSLKLQGQPEESIIGNLNYYRLLLLDMVLLKVLGHPPRIGNALEIPMIYVSLLENTHSACKFILRTESTA